MTYLKNVVFKYMATDELAERETLLQARVRLLLSSAAALKASSAELAVTNPNSSAELAVTQISHAGGRIACSHPIYLKVSLTPSDDALMLLVSNNR